MKELLHFNWKCIVSSVGLAYTLSSAETAIDSPGLLDYCWGAVRIILFTLLCKTSFLYNYCEPNAIICEWKSVLLALNHVLVESGKNRLSLKINEGTSLPLVTMSEELKDFSYQIFNFLLIIHFSRFNSWPLRVTSILFLVTISPLNQTLRSQEYQLFVM